MARRTTKKKDLTPEEKLAQALVPVEEQPYEVPGNWCWVKHNSILDISGGSQPSKSHFISEPQVGYVQLYQTRDYGERPVPVYIPEKYATKTTNEGDILLARYGGSLGKVFRAHKGAYNVALAKVIRQFPNIVDDEFLFMYYHSHFYQDFCVKASSGRSAQAGFNRNDMEGLPFPLPPLPEQQRIVARIESLFAKLDEAKEKAQAVVDGFEERKAAILHKAFTGELTKKWREERGIDLDSWKTQKLSDTSITIIDGDRGNNYPKKNDFSSDGYCIFLSAKNVTKSGFRFDNLECITKEKDEQLRNGRLERGDMVLTTRGTIGNTAIYDNTVPYEHLRINSGMVIYRGGDEFIKQFLVWLYQSKLITNQIERLRTGTAQPQLPIKVMKMLLLPIPMLEEQTEIVRILDSLLDKQRQAKSAAEQVLDQIDTMKKAILARAFRGELGTNDPQEESALELVRRALDE